MKKLIHLCFVASLLIQSGFADDLVDGVKSPTKTAEKKLVTKKKSKKLAKGSSFTQKAKSDESADKDEPADKSNAGAENETEDNPSADDGKEEKTPVSEERKSDLKSELEKATPDGGTVNLSSQTITDEEFEFIVNFIHEKGAKNVFLNFSGSEFETTGLVMLLSFMSANQGTITSIDLSNNSLEQMIVQTLNEHPVALMKVATLNLSGNNIGDGELDALGQIISRCGALTYLNLSNNKLTNPIKLAEQAKDIETTKFQKIYIDLKENPIDPNIIEECKALYGRIIF